MRNILISFVCLLIPQLTSGQLNCSLLKDSSCVKACEMSDRAADFQGSKYSQELFDQAIILCPTYAYSYFEKSVPYLKQGLWKEWKELMDKAVDLDSQYLLNRGCNQVQYIRNYKSGLNDLNKLYELRGKFDIGFNPSGEYHGQLIRAICYQKLGDIDKAIEIVEQMVSQTNYSVGLYDYFHLGVMYLDAGEVEKAKKSFDKQVEENEFAEIYYYYSEIYLAEKNKSGAVEALEKAKNLYDRELILSNTYYHYIDKVFYGDIEKELTDLTVWDYDGKNEN